MDWNAIWLELSRTIPKISNHVGSEDMLVRGDSMVSRFARFAAAILAAELDQTVLVRRLLHLLVKDFVARKLMPRRSWGDRP
jgi:hypothetical protein